MKAKAMCIKRICIAFFDAADDSAANSYYPKKLFQAVRGNNGNAAELNIINLRKKWKGICSQVPFIVLKYRQGCI